MNRSPMGFIVTPAGSDRPPFIAKCIIEDLPNGMRVLVDDGAGGRWFPRVGLGTFAETDDALELTYAAGQLGETGLKLEPVNVERWTALAARRPEMIPVGDIDELSKMMRW